MFRARGGPLAALALPDGRWLTARWMRPRRPYGLPIALGLLALAVGVGAYPLARRITGRLERLQARVEALGQGDLAARVDVEGRDEVARLAESFNHAAQRIERMVAAQRSMLASASHELRSPLARMRMGLALMEREDRPELRAQLHREIAELDELVGEILLAARLDAGAPPGQIEQVDLLGLLAEEGARIDVEPTGQAMLVHGERRLLRRMMRNLLENARRHAPIESIECSVQPGGDGGVRIEVCDRGPGVPGEERERIFEPFYRASGASEDADGGYGLGLALVRQIARRHGGEAWCVNRPGGGACFVVELAAPGPSPQRR
jgi:signal transduction histidine kinase